MVDAPEKIWIDQDDCPYFYEESELAEAGSPVTEYIRADLCHCPALEPSAARKLALEDAAKLLEREACELDGLVDSVSHHLRSKAKAVRALYPAPTSLPQDVINLVIAAREACDTWLLPECEFNQLDKALEPFGERVPYENEPDAALSSPDHADAGKVEGDGWPTGEYEVDYEVICNGEWVAGSTDLNDAKHYASVYSHDGEIEIVEARTYRRPLPSAPSEGAE